MGVERLVLVAPRCSPTEEAAKQGAAHAQDVLRRSTTYSTLAEFHAAEGSGLRLALSGKDAKLKGSLALDAVLDSYVEEPAHAFNGVSTPLYLYFGPEDDGLSNDEMELCHQVCKLPTFGEITSLNLSHAVLLTLYIVRAARRASGRDRAIEKAATGEVKAQPIFYPAATIHRWLEALGFDLGAPRVTIEKTLNRILLSRAPSEDELRIVDSVLQQTVRKLTERQAGR